MPYATLADLKKHMSSKDILGFVNDEGLSNNTEAEADTGLADATVAAIIDDYLSEADNEINGWVYGHCDVTDATVAAMLKRPCAIIALYNMACRSQIGVGEGLEGLAEGALGFWGYFGADHSGKRVGEWRVRVVVVAG